MNKDDNVNTHIRVVISGFVFVAIIFVVAYFMGTDIKAYVYAEESVVVEAPVNPVSIQK